MSICLYIREPMHKIVILTIVSVSAFPRTVSIQNLEGPGNEVGFDKAPNLVPGCPPSFSSIPTSSEKLGGGHEVRLQTPLTPSSLSFP